MTRFTPTLPENVADVVAGLLPCPFCGGEGDVLRYRAGEHPWAVHYNHKEFCPIRRLNPFNHGAYETQSKAIDAWNTRTPAPTLLAENAALRTKMRMIVSHATGGDSSDIDASTNDICVAITRMRNHVYQAGKEKADAALKEREAKLADLLGQLLPWAEPARLREEAQVLEGTAHRNPITKLVNKCRAALLPHDSQDTAQVKP